MFQVAVLEDEEPIREYIKEKIMKNGKGLVSVDAFESGENLLAMLEKKPYHIYYLDIELKNSETDGYAIARKIRCSDKCAIIIFVSSHDEYACEAYEMEVLRFLQKPILEEKLKESLNKALEIIGRGEDTFCYKINRKEYEIPVNEILYFESKGKKIIIHTVKQKKIEFYGTIKEIGKHLCENYFEQCHKSYLVNIEYITDIMGDCLYVNQDRQLPISRGYKERLKSSYYWYIRFRSREEF